MSSAEPALTFERVGARHGANAALEDVSLAVAKGSVVSLIGPNGAGKSTLVALAAGLRTPERGAVRALGADPRRRGARRSGAIGLASQETGLYPSLSVRQNVAFCAELAGRRPRAARREADELIERLGLGALASRPADGLSGGERRRAHVAGALVGHPRLVLLDEPTEGADPSASAAVLEAVREAARSGAGVLYATHDLAEIERLGGEVALLATGRLIACGPVDEIVARHSVPGLVLRFDGPPPPRARALAGARVRGDAVRVERSAGDDLARVTASLGADARRLRSVEAIGPSLEDAYRTLTGMPGPDLEWGAP